MKSTTARLATVAPLLGACLLAGCANLTGLDGSSHYGCKAPDGVKCDSVSGTYYNAVQNNLPSQRRPATSQAESQTAPVVSPATRGPEAMATTARSSVDAKGTGYMATPLRAAPRILRLWIKPWEDADRDLNGESLVYVQVDNGRWLVDHAQRQARDAYAPVRPAKLPTSAAKRDPDVGSKGTQQQVQAAPEPGASITQGLRALQNRSTAPSDD